MRVTLLMLQALFITGVHYHTLVRLPTERRNTKQQNTEQQIRNGKTRNTKSGMVKRQTTNRKW